MERIKKSRAYCGLNLSSRCVCLGEAYAVAFDWAEQNGDTPEYNLRGNLIATAYGIKRIRRIVNGSTDTYKNR